MVYAPGAESSATSLLNAAVSCMEEPTVPQPPLDITATILVLDHQELFVVERPPPGEPP